LETFVSGAIFTDAEMTKSFRDNVAQAITLIVYISKIDTRESSRIKSYIPSVVMHLYEADEWSVMIRRRVTTLAGTSEPDAERQLIEKLRSWKTFGSMFFKTIASNDARFPDGCILAIGLDGVRIIDKNDRVSKFENIGDNV
jgi:hypothetical protein